jgi:16S rRNA processing protein RimM
MIVRLPAFLLLLLEVTHGLVISKYVTNLEYSRPTFRSATALFSSPFLSANATTEPLPTRRRKKNKYEQFSKVESLELDPFEALIAESTEQNMLLQDELIDKRNRRNRDSSSSSSLPSAPIVMETPPMYFPDVKTIDPYDPTTFGYVEIASIGGAHGVFGMIKVRCLTDFASERLCTPGIRHVKAPSKRAPRPIILLEGRPSHGDEYLIRLEGIDDREAAMKLRGSVLYAREEDLMETDSEEFIVSDLIGLDVYLYEEKEIGERNFVGKVNGVVFAEDLTDIPGLHDFLELTLPRGQGGTASLYDELVLIPLVPQLVPIIDIESGSIYIDPTEGLLDLTYVRQEKVRIKAFLPASKTISSTTNPEEGQT